MAWASLLKGADGTVELNRLVGFVGGVLYIVCANVFTGWEVFMRGRDFDITAYCLAFPGGLAVASGGSALAIAVKDRSVATARATLDASAAAPGGPDVIRAGDEVTIAKPPA